MRRRAAPKRGSSRWTRRTTRATSAPVIASGTDRSERWIVRSATRRPPPTNIIATSAAPAASASISVCPGQGCPAARSDSLCRGAVTTAVHAPGESVARRGEDRRRRRAPGVGRDPAELERPSVHVDDRALERRRRPKRATRSVRLAGGP